MSEPSRKVIHNHGTIQVVDNGYKTDTIFVTFNEFYLKANGTRFWGDTLFDRIAISAIGVVTTEPNWYPESDLNRAVEAMIPHVRGRRVILYGHSQGGYGALKCSSALHASTVIASGPQFTIDKAYLNSDEHWYTKFYKKSLRNGLPIKADDLGGDIYILYDPWHNLENFNTQCITRISQEIKPIIFPFSNHRIPLIIAQEGRSAEFIRIFVEEKSERCIRALFRKVRKNSTIYKETMIQKLTNWRHHHRRYIERVFYELPADSKKSIIEKCNCPEIRECLESSMCSQGLDEMSANYSG